MAVLYTPHFVQFEDDNGDPLSGGKLFTYAAGTTTNKATYTTAAGTIENANPVILDSAGRAVIFIEGSYRFDLFDANDNLIKSTDNVTSFTTLTDSADSFFQSFSGDSSTTAFVLSTDLGTDEKTIMVFVDDGLNEYVTNGNFATDTDWTKGSGWVIGSGIATATTASTALSQDSDITFVEGQSYNITYTITRSAGTVTPSIGGTDGEARSASGTYVETIIAGSSQSIAFTGASFSGTVDNVSVTKVQSSGANILNPNQYTLDGTNLTFVTAPATGTNNILVFAPSQLAGAASAAASAAQAAESAAVTAQAAAEAAAGLLDVSSTTSVLIGTGTKTFTITADLGLTAGQFVLIDSDADGSNYMYGQITDYTGTSLEVNVLATGGSGTFADWTITLIGIQGIQGATGSINDLSGVSTATPTVSDTLVFTDVDDSNITKKATTVNVVGATLLDEDNMASDSATRGATQQSIKAYVDTTAKIQLQTVVSTASGTAIDFTSIPSGVKIITVMLNNVSTDGTAGIKFQLGDSGGVETTGYITTKTTASAASTTSNIETTGFMIAQTSAARTFSGFVTFKLMDESTNTWVGSGSFARDSDGITFECHGIKPLSGTLDRIRVGAVGDNYDAGSMSISWEF